MGAGARAAGRLGQQRPLRALGEHARGRAAVVAGHHHRARSQRDRGQRAGASPAPSSSGRASQLGRPAVLRREGVVEADIQVHDRAAGRARSAEPGVLLGTGTAERPPWAPAARRSRPGRWSGWRPVPRSRAGRSAVTATMATPACVASSSAGCRLATAVPEVQITGGARPDLGQPEREEAGRALVDPGVQPDQPGLGRVVRRERERRVPRPGRQHDLADARSRPGGRRRRARARWTTSRCSQPTILADGQDRRQPVLPPGDPVSADAATASSAAGYDGPAGAPAARRRPGRAPEPPRRAVSSGPVASPQASGELGQRRRQRESGGQADARSPARTRPRPAARCPRRSAGRPAPRRAAATLSTAMSAASRSRTR